MKKEKIFYSNNFINNISVFLSSVFSVSKYLFVYLVFLIQFLGFGFGAEANSCKVCGSPSIQFKKYIDFSNEILAIIPKSASQKQDPLDAGQYLGAGNQGFQTIFVTTMLLSDFPGNLAKGTMLEIVVVGRGKPMIRDRNSIAQIEEMVNSSVLDLGFGAKYFKDLSTSDLSKVNAILKKYRADAGGMFAVGTQVAPGTNRNEITSLIRRFNAKWKRFFAFGSVSQFSEKINGFDTNQIFFDNLDQEYSCVKGFDSCSDSLGRFGENIKSTTKSSISEAKKSKDVILKSIKNLKELFKQVSGGQPNKQFIERQNELLRSQYGLRKLDAGGSGFVGIKKMLGSIKNSANGIIDSVFNFDKKDSIDENKKEVDSSKKYDNDLPQVELDQKSLQANFIKSMEDGFLDVLYQQEQENLKNNFIDVSNISKIFPFISEIVSQNIELIGNKQNGVIKTLGNACENQCKNTNPTCRY